MIDAIKRGDELAFEEAYVQHRQKVYAYFIKKTKSCEDAIDLLQVTFLKLWHYRQSLSAEYLLDQHLFHIARTVFIDYIRRQNKEQKIINAAVNKLNQEPAYVFAPAEFDLQYHLQSALSSMPQLRKIIFELHRIQGYSYKEIAALLSIPVKSVDNNLAKALKQLKNITIVCVIFFIQLK